MPRFRRTVIALDLHDTFTGNKNPQILRLVTQFVDSVIAVSEFTASQVRSPRPTVLLRPAAASDEVPALPAEPGGPLVVGLVGRVDEAKQHRLAIRALGLTEANVRLIVRGAPAFAGADTGAAYVARLEQEVAESPYDIRLEGRVPPESALAGLDVVLVANADEPMGRTAVEAQLRGLTVIVPDRRRRQRAGRGRCHRPAFRGWQRPEPRCCVRKAGPRPRPPAADRPPGKGSSRRSARPGDLCRGLRRRTQAPPLPLTGPRRRCGQARGGRARRRNRGARRLHGPARRQRRQHGRCADLDRGDGSPAQARPDVATCRAGQPSDLSDRLAEVFDSVDYLGFDRSSNAVPMMVRDLYKVVARFQPDVIHSHLLHADLASAAAASRQAGQGLHGPHHRDDAGRPAALADSRLRGRSHGQALRQGRGLRPDLPRLDQEHALPAGQGHHHPQRRGHLGWPGSRRPGSGAALAVSLAPDEGP